MAKNIKNNKGFEELLWEAANNLRGTVESSEYKHVVLSLIFLKFANDKFNVVKEKLVLEGRAQYIDMVPFYTRERVFYVPKESRWDYIVENSKQPNISLIVDTALSKLEENNDSLKGALPDNYYSRLSLEVNNLSSLIDIVNNLDTIKDSNEDIIGRVYEYFLKKFALKEGKGKGEFYTPKTVVTLMTELIQPYKGKIYDPACGSGGMFVQSMKFVEAHHGNTKDVSIYGQEMSSTTYKLAKMNLAIRGILANLGEKPANTFSQDQHKDLKADYILANPPFNQSKWRKENELTDDDRWLGYDVPPTGNANYGWILTMVSKLSSNGVAAFLLANGSLSGGGSELEIRKKLIENNLVDAVFYLPRNLFYTTDIGVSLWIISNNKNERTIEVDKEKIVLRDRKNEVLFVDLRQTGVPFEKKYIEFSPKNLKEISTIYHNWQSKDGFKHYNNIPEFCYSATTEEIVNKNFSLAPNEYIEFINNDENINYHKLMEKLTLDLRDLMMEEEQSKEELLDVLKELGYEIEL
ncbi:MAG: DNA methyltransferase [Tenericutes bacterium HGW-Tenericutes-7]|jgi:type I restriction enzyme M protein|nr:MAG: DNA methyltransferase [Tenericutes bacterium HGW-Tenericutes-7]PKK97530.1 MAG: DNA methyltransferase [Tenericutes bacterium HGW-Tenericutes-3]